MSYTRKRKRAEEPTITILISAHGEILPEKLDEREMKNVYSYNPMPVSTCIIWEETEKSDMISIKTLIDKYKKNKSDKTIMKDFCKEFGKYYQPNMGKKTQYNRKRFTYFVNKYLSKDKTRRREVGTVSDQIERPYSESDIKKIKKLKKKYKKDLIKSEDEDKYDDLIDFYNIEQALTQPRLREKLTCNIKRYKRDKSFMCKQIHKFKTYTGITLINTNEPELIESFLEPYTFDIQSTSFCERIKNANKMCENIEYKKIMHQLIPTLDSAETVGRDEIKLSEIVTFLKNLGYEKIYIYDMSCNAEEERNVESAESIATNIKSAASAENATPRSRIRRTRGGGDRRTKRHRSRH